MGAALLCAGWGLSASAAAAGGLDDVGGGIVVVSDKVVRGLSQSDGQASAAADLVWRDDSGWAMSAGAATLGRSQRRGKAELHVGVGLGGVFADDASWLVAATHYVTLRRAGAGRPDYDELLFGLGGQQLRAALTVAPNYVNPVAGATPRRGTGLYAELTWHQPLYMLAPQLQGLALDAGVGRAEYQRITLAGYSYGNLGLEWSQGPWQLTASRIFSNSRAPTAAGPRALLSAMLSF